MLFDTDDNVGGMMAQYALKHDTAESCIEDFANQIGCRIEQPYDSLTYIPVGFFVGPKTVDQRLSRHQNMHRQMIVPG